MTPEISNSVADIAIDRRSALAGIAASAGLLMAAPLAGQAPRSTPAAAFAAPRAAAKLDAALTEATRKGLFSGAVLVAQGDRIVFHRAYGLASREYAVPNTSATRFNLASANKMFTAVLVAQLVEAGRLRYEDKIGQYIGPDWVADETAREKVTVGQLLSHTSGLTDYFNEDYVNAARDRFVEIDDFKPLAVNTKLRFEPGTNWSYSNIGFLLAGVIVEKVTGESYFDRVRKKILEPAGMTATAALNLAQINTSYAQGYTRWIAPPKGPANVAPPPGPPPLGPRQDLRLLAPATAKGQAELAARDFEWRNNIFAHVVKGGPAGGMFSTTSDLLRFLNALDSGRLVPPARVAEVRAPKPASPRYGYGQMPEDGGHGHTGGFLGISAVVLAYPDGWRTIILSNVDGGSAVAYTELLEMAARR